MEQQDHVEILDIQKGYLALPFEKEQFSSFIKSLLGTPQTITRTISGVFNISLNDLQHFNELITQRITQQNKGTIIELKSTIFFSDKSSVTMNSLEELSSYNEIKPVLSVAIRMTWSFLIQFEDKKSPERQEIELYFCSSNENYLIEKNEDILEANRESFFYIEIRHTARTWGVDMENLIVNQIKSIQINASKLHNFINNHSFIIAAIVFFSLILSFLFAINISTNQILDGEKQKLFLYIDKNPSIGEKIDYLLKIIIVDSKTDLSEIKTSFILLSMILSSIISLWCLKMAGKRQKGFLVLTRHSKTDYDKFQCKIQRDWFMFWLSLFIGFITSITATYLYESIMPLMSSIF